MKKEYTKPEIKNLGNMIKVTHGADSGVNDPGGANSTGGKTKSW